MKHVLPLSILSGLVALLFCDTAAAQNQDDFFDRELVVNGSAEEFDSSNELVGWTLSDGYSMSVTAKKYDDADFAESDIPSGESGTSWLFCGRGNGLFSYAGSSSYQLVEIPSSVFGDIDSGEATAYMSALVGGYAGQDDNITVIYSYLDSQSTVLGETRLGPVYSDERGGKTCLIAKNQSVAVPSGTRSVRVEIVAEEKALGSDVDGYADHISLVIRKAVEPASIGINKSVSNQGENLAINYTNIPDGSHISIFREQSVLPLKITMTVEGDAFGNNGTFEVGNTLEPGDYTAVCRNADGENIADSIFFTVRGEYTAGDKNIFVMSDIHVMNPELLVSEGSAFDEYLATDRKLLVESEAILSTMVDTIISLHPELVLIPGDLTKDGELKSHQLVAGYLHRIADEGIQVLVIPGNHDVNNPHALIYDGERTEYAETVTPEQFAEIYSDFGYGEACARDEHSLSYAFEPYDGLVVICIDACRYEDNTFVSQGAAEDVCVTDGRIKSETMQWICEQAKKANREGKQVIAMMHHNLVEHFNMQASIAAPYVVADAATVREQFMDAGIHTVFTGHFHISDIAKDYNEARTDSIYDIATGSTVTYPCPFRRVKLNADNTLLDISSNVIRRLDGEGDKYEHFDVYAKEKLANGIVPMVDGLIHDYWDYINQMLDQVEAGLPLPGIIVRPSTPEALSAIVADCFGEAGIKTYLTFSESNEHNKLTDGVMDEIKAGVDKAMESLIASWALGLAKDKIHETVDPMLEQVVGSILENKTNKGTDRESLSNDLYATISLPSVTPENPSGISEDVDALFSVYPTVTDGQIDINVSDDVDDIVIFDITGRVVGRYHTEGECTIVHSFSQSGVYLVKAVGHGDVVKVIVR